MGRLSAEFESAITTVNEHKKEDIFVSELS